MKDLTNVGLELCLKKNLLITDRYITKILLITSKKAITRNWCKAEPPTKDQWMDIIREVYIMEKMTYQLRMRVNNFEGKWKKWIVYDTGKRLGHMLFRGLLNISVYQL